MKRQLDFYEELSFYKNKKVLITGHSGFKGSWMCVALHYLGAQVYGISLPISDMENLYNISNVDSKITSFWGDIRDLTFMQEVFKKVEPEIVFHLAAQPLVLESYKNPVETYSVNVMGTVQVCECIKENESVCSFVNITTDKVYKNQEWEWGYRETDVLGGFDPYSNSKACSELVTESYKNSFFLNRKLAVSTVRAGNVIGGGDFAKNRIIPDCYRAAKGKEKICVRNPYSVRPYQHVLEPVILYLLIAKRQSERIELSGHYNIGPNDEDCINTGKLVQMFCEAWGEDQEWIFRQTNGPHEANNLKLDCSKVKKNFQWEPIWSTEKAVQKSVEWYKKYLNKEKMDKVMQEQLLEFFMDGKNKCNRD